MMKTRCLTLSSLALLTAGATLAFGDLTGRDIGSRDTSQRVRIAPNAFEAAAPEEADPAPVLDLFEPQPSDDFAELTVDQENAVSAPGSDEVRRAVRVVATVLELGPEQVEQLVSLLQRRREAAAPVKEQIRFRQELLRELVEAGDHPAAIGRQVLEIRDLRRQLYRIQMRFLETFESILSDRQLDRWQAVRLAARLSPVLPAFQALALL